MLAGEEESLEGRAMMKASYLGAMGYAQRYNFPTTWPIPPIYHDPATGCNRSLPKALCRQLFILRAFSRFQMDDRHRLGRQVPPMDLLPDSTQLDHPQVQNHLAPRNRP